MHYSLRFMHSTEPGNERKLEHKKLSYFLDQKILMNLFISQMTLKRIFLLILVIIFDAPSASPQVTISGTLLGVHGKPMELAHVLICQPPDYLPQKIIATDESGSYSFTVDSLGIWIFKFIGVHHREKNVAVFLNDQANIGLDVQLGSFTYVKDFDNVKVNSTLNNWNILSPCSMQKDSNGTYSAVLNTTSDTIEYQLMNVRYGGPYEGTQADRYAYRKSRGYVSIVGTQEKKATIVFDPKKLIEAQIPAQVHLICKDSRTIQFSCI